MMMREVWAHGQFARSTGCRTASLVAEQIGGKGCERGEAVLVPYAASMRSNAALVNWA